MDRQIAGMATSAVSKALKDAV